MGGAGAWGPAGAVMPTGRLGPAPGWRNWQTRRTQNPLAARSCGFKSRPGHHNSAGHSVIRPRKPAVWSPTGSHWSNLGTTSGDYAKASPTERDRRSPNTWRESTAGDHATTTPSKGPASSSPAPGRMTTVCRLRHPRSVAPGRDGPGPAPPMGHEVGFAWLGRLSGSTSVDLPVPWHDR